ncbi:MAG: type II toxin-antitoxin system HicA family toxin [Bryobacteraceae bacterium]|nr:type II toxin-antitoxin system HicA family toxin [Bryobacteraceae bacterium]
MSNWPATKARRVLAARLKRGWRVKRQRGSHRVLAHPDKPDFEFAFHDQE